VSILHWVLGLVALQRLAELALAAHNTRRLKARGALEVGQSHYPLIVLLHAAWLVALALLVPAATRPFWPLLALFTALQAGRVWVIASLGHYWTTRIITLPDAPLVRRGPYRYLRHPNYLIVALEIAVLPLAFGAIGIAIVFSLLNGAMLWHRLRVETQALAGRR
jgi:methyltransferase